MKYDWPDCIFLLASHMSSILDKIFDCRNWDIFEEHIQYKVFTTSNAWGGIVRFGNAEFMVKVAGYSRWLTLDPNNIPAGARHHVATEIAMLQVIKEKIILANYSPAFVEIICHKDCPMNTHGSDSEERHSRGTGQTEPRLNSLNSMLARGKQADVETVAVVILEKCTYTFGRFIPNLMFEQHVEVFKSILFVLVHGWYVLHTIIPDFRHGDTHKENFMVKLDDDSGFVLDPPVNIFYAEGATFAVPYYGIFPKVIDFDHARSESLGIVTYTAKMQMVDAIPNELARLFHEIAGKLTTGHGRPPFAKGALILLTSMYAGDVYDSMHEYAKRFPTTTELILSEPFKTYRVSSQVLSREEIMRERPALKIRHIYRNIGAQS